MTLKFWGNLICTPSQTSPETPTDSKFIEHHSPYCWGDRLSGLKTEDTEPFQLPILPQTVKPNQPFEVHLWQADLRVSPPELMQLRSLLSEPEEARSQRFRFPQHQRQFIAARSYLRQILSCYLSCAPNSIQFHYNDYGKPLLLPLPDGNTLTFNLSHAEDLAVYAVTWNREVGIDLENIYTDRNFNALQSICLSPNEQIAFAQLLPHQQLLAFFALWTRKEAYLKAIGQGLSLAPNQVEISLNSSAPLLRVKQVTQPNWLIRDLPFEQGNADYIGAIAIAI